MSAPFFGEDLSLLPPEIQARLMGAPAASPFPAPGVQEPVPEAAPQLAPHDRPGGNYLDRLAMALSQVNLPQATRPQGAFGQNFLSGLATSFAGNRMADMQQRQQMSQRASEAARTLNAHRWATYEKQAGEQQQHLFRMSENAAKAKVGAAGNATPEQVKEMGGAPGQVFPATSYLSFKANKEKAGSAIDQGSSLGGAIVSGRIAPNFLGNRITAQTKPVWDYLANYKNPDGSKGYDVNKATSEYNALQAWIRTMNGRMPMQTRQSAFALEQGLDLIDQKVAELKKLVPAPQQTMLAKVVLSSAKDWNAFGPEAGARAREIVSLMSDLQPEAANVYQAGGVPTEMAMKLATKALSTDIPLDQIPRQTAVARQNTMYRINAIKSSQQVTPWNFPIPMTQGTADMPYQAPLFYGGGGGGAADTSGVTTAGDLMRKGGRVHVRTNDVPPRTGYVNANEVPQGWQVIP